MLHLKSLHSLGWGQNLLFMIWIPYLFFVSCLGSLCLVVSFCFSENFCNPPFLLLASIFSASLSLNSGGRLPLTFLTFLSNFKSFPKKSNKSAPFLLSRSFPAFDDHPRDQTGKLKSNGFFF